MMRDNVLYGDRLSVAQCGWKSPYDIGHNIKHNIPLVLLRLRAPFLFLQRKLAENPLSSNTDPSHLSSIYFVFNLCATRPPL